VNIQVTIHVTWDDPDHKTLLWTVEGRWTWTESHEAIAKAEAFMDSVPHKQVDSIVDMSRGHLIPENAVSNFSRTLRVMHPKAGLIVMSGMPPIVQALLSVLTRVQSSPARKIIVVKTLDEARAVLGVRREEASSGQ
jgi:hypothetical protein